MSRARATAAGFVLGGLLWAFYGAMTMLKPWGDEVRFSDARGYSLVVDDALFLLYNGPGAAALLVTSMAVLALVRGLEPRHRRLTRAGTVAVRVAVGLGALSLAGVVAFFDPLFTASRVAGALLLGLGAVLLSVATAPGRGSSAGLAAAGVLALGLMPLWPLVYAVRVLPEWGGAVYFGLFGLAWLVLGRLAPVTPTR